MTTLLDAELIGVFEHDTPEWLEARASIMGSSDVASILGLSSYKSAYTLWHEKAGLIQPGEPDERTQRKYDYGHHMEPFVARLFLREHAPSAQFVGYGVADGEAGTWRNIERPWQGCNPDRIFLDQPRGDSAGIVEIKTFPMLSDWQPEPPAGYIAQLKWQLDTFGFRRGYLAGYANMSGDYVEHPVTLNPFEAEATRARVLAFANSITDGEPPEIDGSEGTFETLRRLNPSINYKEEREIPHHIAENYLEAQAGLKAATSESNKWKGHLLAHMGTAQYATYNGERIASRYAPRKDAVPTLKEA